MIGPQIRRAALGNFPIGTPVLIVAGEAAGFAQLLAERGDANAAWTPLAAQPPVSDAPHLLLEGIDDLSDPLAYLRAARTSMPEARIFSLISNAAHLAGLGAFYAGHPLAGGHPLSFAEVRPLFETAGWNVLAIQRLVDDAMPLPNSAPVVVTAGGIGFDCATPEALEHGRTAAFLVIADRA
jgi:hypothetical protein